MDAKKPKKYLQVYKDSYGTEFSFISKSRKGKSFAFCSDCGTDINIAHSGKGDILTHTKSKKHQANLKEIESNVKIETLFTTSEDYSVTRAECLFTSFIIEHNLPLRCADHAGPLFRKMFPKCETARRYGAARTKTSAILKEMAVSEQSSLITCLKKQAFSIATDGSNDSDNKLYPIVVTYFNKLTSLVECKLLCLPVLNGESTGRNIGNLVVDAIVSKNIPIENCIAFGCDNANVMTGKNKGVAAVLSEAHKEIVIARCLCHLVDIAAGRGADTLPVNVGELLVDIFYYLKRSSKRKDRLKHFQELQDTEVEKILKHVETRWLSVGKCLTRINNQWAPLLSFFEEESSCGIKRSASAANLSSYKIPKVPKGQEKNKVNVEVKGKNENKKMVILSNTSKESLKNKAKPEQGKIVKQSKVKSRFASGDSQKQRIFNFLLSDLNKSYCLFLENSIQILERVCTRLQTRQPMIYILRQVLLDLFKELLSKFVKPTVMKNCSDVLDIDYHSHDHQKDDDELVIGYTTSKVVESLDEKSRTKFFFHVRKYFVAILDYMYHSFPFKSDILINAEALNISNIVNAKFSNLKFFVEKFPIILFKKDQETIEKAMDVLQSEFCEFQMEDLPAIFRKEERIDTQWCLIRDIKNGMGEKKFEHLAKTMLSLMAIPHSNAECERIFSQVRKIRTEFRATLSNESLESLLIMKCAEQTACFEKEFSKEFLKKAKSATYLSQASSS